MAADIRVGSSGSVPREFTVFDNAVYFQANNGNDGNRLWKYDGTTVSMVANSGSSPAEMAVFDSALHYRAAGQAAWDLWKFDGTTAAATGALPGLSNLSPTALTVYNDELYFFARHGGVGQELHKFDGNTVSLVADITPGTGDYVNPEYDLYGMAVYNDTLFFMADDGVHGRELWAHDGTQTALIADLIPGPDGGMGSTLDPAFVSFDGALYFYAFVGESGGGPSQLFRITGDGIPEPATLSVMAVLGLLLARRRRRAPGETVPCAPRRSPPAG